MTTHGDGSTLGTKLVRIAQIAEERPKERFTSVAHMLDKDMLMACHRELSRKRAPGIDGITKDEYGENLEERIELLHRSLRGRRYGPEAVRRVYISREGSNKERPLGIRCMRTRSYN